MKYIPWELNYEKLDLDKIQSAYEDLKDIVDIEGCGMEEIHNVASKEMYSNIKSWRSNALEGNTTKLKNLKKIVENGLKDDDDKKINIVDIESADEELEIVNLVKIYYDVNVEYNIGSISNVNYVLGKGIKFNKFNSLRGKFKTEENVIEYTVHSEYTKYIVNFCEPKFVIEELKKLISFIKNNTNKDLTFSNVFVLGVIFNMEFNRIHPFIDGNGRTGRVFMEKIFEDHNYVPLIFAREESKKKYKEALFQSDKVGNKYEYAPLIKKFAALYKDEVEMLISLLEEQNNFK